MRLAAILLLSLMCLDLGMDLWQGEMGDSDSAETTVISIYTAQMPLSISSGGQQSKTTDFNHECFCCCSQLEQQGAVTVAVVLESNPSRSDATAHSLDSDPVRIYHPPQHIV